MRKLQVTKEGKRFLIAMVLIGFAAINTGNNLIYLILSLMLSLTLISVTAAFVNLRGLRCEIDLKEPVYAREPFRVTVATENKKIIPSYSVSVVLPESSFRHLYFPIVKRGHNRGNFHEVVIKRRGEYFFSDFKLRTGFPFIFMYLHKTFDYRKQLIVYPRVFDASRLIERVLSQVSGVDTMRRGQEGDFFSVREYVYGEESRAIDWKATAKVQKTMVREFSSREEKLATVILDSGGGSREAQFEKAVSTAASLCSEFAERGFYIRLITCRKVVPYGKGRAHLFKLLDILAKVEPMDISECPLNELVSGLSILVVCSDMPGFSRFIPHCSGVIDARDL